MEQYVVKNEICKDYVWYVCELEIADEFPSDPKNTWLVQVTETQRKFNALVFSKRKAELLAYVLNNQPDEEGYIGIWEIEKLIKENKSV